jgi:hypothetical protein
MIIKLILYFVVIASIINATVFSCDLLATLGWLIVTFRLATDLYTVYMTSDE